MARIYSSDLTNNIVKSIKGQQNRESMPIDIAEKVLPVINVNPHPEKITTVVKSSNTSGGVIYTTPTTADFYLTSASLSMIKDAASTSVRTAITVVINGATVSLMTIAGITLTAQNDSLSQTYVCPIKLDRGSAISTTSTAAGPVVGACIQGFEISD